MFRRVLLICSLFLISFPAFSQDVIIEQNQNGEYQYQEVLKVENTSQEKIYDRINLWIAKNYVSANDVIQYENKETGKIIVKGNVSTTNYGWKVYLMHTLTIETKDDKFRITLDQFKYQAAGSSPVVSFSGSVPRKKKMLDKLENELQSSVTDLYGTVHNESDDDW